MFFTALLPQFVSTSGNAVETLAVAQAAILLLALGILAAQALFAGSTLALVRRMSGNKNPAEIPHSLHFWPCRQRRIPPHRRLKTATPRPGLPLSLQ